MDLKIIGRVKVLWFSNCVLSKDASRGSGSWLFAMRDLIATDIELINIAEDSVGCICTHEGNKIREYLIPQWRLHKGIPSEEKIQEIIEIVNSEKPDLIHIWGVEKYWALLFSRGYIKSERVLLEIQGVLSACTDVFWGGLTPKESKGLVSFRAVLYPPSKLSNIYRSFKRNSIYEEEIIRYFDNIAVQSKWTREQLSSICGQKTNFFYSLRPIRQEFYKARKWIKPNNSNPVVFCTVSYYTPFKGFHFLLRALHVLVQQNNNITLRVAGFDLSNRPFYVKSDYERFILKEITRLGLQNNIHFCGPLKAPQLVEEILSADVIVNPSLVESFSAAAAEALYLGAPVVLAYAGAMVNFSDDKEVALYYNPMDYRSLASKIKILMQDEICRNRLSTNAIEILNQICSPLHVKERQLEIYRTLTVGKET